MDHKQTNLEWATTLMGEKLLFGLLGKILYSELDKTWLQSLIDENVFAESPFGEDQAEVQTGLALLRAWSQENQSGISDQAFLDLQIDSTHLFVGVGKILAPIWESVYFSKERMIFQERTLKVRNWYHRFGLASEKLHQEPDDHIGLEFAFLAHLAHLALQALDRKDERAFLQILESQQEFFREHLGSWALKWCDLVEQYAKTNFYQGLAHLTRGAVLALSGTLEVELPKEAVS